MGILDTLAAKSAPAAPLVVPEFVPSDKSELTDREIAERTLEMLERFEHMAKSFSLQAQAHPLLKGLAPKL